MEDKGWPLLATIGAFFQGIIAFFHISGFYFNLTIWLIAAVLCFFFLPLWQKVSESCGPKRRAPLILLMIIFIVIAFCASLSHYTLCAQTIGAKTHFWQYYHAHVVRFVGSGLKGSSLGLLSDLFAFLLILPYFFLVIFPSFLILLPIVLPLFTFLFPPERTGETRNTLYSVDSKGNRQAVSSKLSANADAGPESAWLFNDFGRNMRKFILYQAAYVAVFVWIYFCW
jgi:hypothetical protein